MKRTLGMLAGVLLAGALVLGGCGKKDEQPTRFNQTLGETPVGAPVATHSLDSGILKDPTTYKPAAYEPLEPQPAGAGAGGAEARAVQAVVNNLIAGIFDGFDIETILDCFVPEQVAALRQDECISAFHELKDTFDAFFAVLEEKASGPDMERLNALLGALPTLAEPLKNAITVSVLDEENAVATFDLGAFELPDEFRSAVEEMMTAATAAMGQMGIPGAPGSPPAGEGAEGAEAAEETPSVDMLLEMISGVRIPIPLRKVGEEWKLPLPFTFQEEHADLLTEGLGLYKDLIADITQGISEAETLDEQTAAQLQMRAMMKMAPIMGWAARVKIVLASTIEAGQPAEPPAEEVEEPSEPNEPDDPNAPAAPPGRGGRRPRGP